MWHTKKLSEVCDIQSGLWKGKKGPYTTALVLRNTNFTASGVFDYSNVVELEVEAKQLANREVIKNDIILEKSGGGEKTPVGRVCIHDKESKIPFSLSNFTARIRVLDSKELNAEFLHKFLYFLYISGKTEPMQRHSTGIRNLQLTQYKDIDVPLPPLAEQECIVAKLNAAFAEIDEEIENIELKIRNVSDLHKIFLDNALGKNKTVPLIDVCHRITDGSHHSPKTLSNEYPYITVKDIFDDKIDFNNCKYVDKSFYEDLVKNNCKPTNGDVLFSKDGTVGKVSLVDYEKDFVVLSSLAIISPNKNIIIPKFLFYTLKSKSFIDEAVGKKTGAAIKRIILKTLKNIKIAVPELNEQTAAIEMLDKFSFEHAKLTQSLMLKLSNMNKLKNSLLKETLSNNEKNNAA